MNVHRNLWMHRNHKFKAILRHYHVDVLLGFGKVEFVRAQSMEYP
jgi:hypothetical protein